MSLFKRIKNIMKSPEPPKPEKSLLTLAPGDMIEVSLVMYELIGKTSMHSRKEIVLTLQDGKDIRYLKIEDRENTYYKLYTPIDGRLDSIDEIPTTIEMDDTEYHMEEQYNGRVVVMGKLHSQLQKNSIYGNSNQIIENYCVLNGKMVAQ